MKRLMLFYFILIAIISFFGVKALFHPGFYTSHDGEHQVLRLYHFDKAIKDGQIPPRWADYQILNGHGYPLFIFSYHAPWIMAEPLRLVGLSLTTTVKLMFILTFFLSGLFMLLWLKELFGEFPAFLGSVLYLWAPYRFSNIFVRASLGEAAAFMFAPLIFYSIEKLNQKEDFRGILIGGIGLCGLILSHVMTSLVFIFPVVIYLLTNLLLSKKRLLYFKKAILLFLLGLSLSAYYTLPAFFERKYTKFSKFFPLNLFTHHFVTLRQLIYSRWGYGFSFPGVEKDGMAFQIGAAQWLSLFLTLVLLGWVFLSRKKLKILEKEKVLKAIGFIFSFLFSLMMMVKFSHPIWVLVTRFIPFDFPWRFLGLSIFSLSFLSAFTTLLLEELGDKRITFLISLFLILLTFYGNRNHLRVNKYIYYDDSHYEKITNSTTSFNEFLPSWAKKKYYDQKRDLVEIVKGQASVRKIERKSDKICFKVENKEKKTVLRITTLFFPGWKLFVNGRRGEFDFENSGMIEFKPLLGHSNVLLIFTKTPIRVIGEIISFSTLIFLVLWILRFRWR